MFINQLEQFQSMCNGGTTDFFFNYGFCYPQYICTGYESSSDWEDRHKFFNLDGQDVQLTASSNEILPYLYYTLDYGYTQSLYNPYNPYIPGASIGVDGSFVAAHQCNTFPSYENLATSPAYMPMILQSRPDVTVNRTANSLFDDAVSVNKADRPVAKPSQKPVAREIEGSKCSAGFGKQPRLSQPSSQYVQGRGPQGTENRLNWKVPSGNSQSKVALSLANGLSNFELINHAQASLAYKDAQKFCGRGPNDAKVSLDTLSEQNQRSGICKNKKQFVVKAYTSKAGTTDTQGNITIYMDQYNKVDFPLIYINAKFFVIKSYSEDDVHKSIKYNVWSSTPNGNQKLNAAYEDARKIAAGNSRGCPIFLMFSVNASGQFCGVAEMTGAVDEHKDMDFWQQDKWNGSFPVKWHIIKDVPNPKFRHIILENNDNKPVTNSRDTQEISFKKGLEMLQIFQNYTLKTSLIDDFMYYESRQRVLQEDKVNLPIKSNAIPNCIPPSDPTQKCGFASIRNIEDNKQHDINSLSTVNAVNFSSEGQSNCSLPTGQVSLDSVVSNSGIVNRIGLVSADMVPTDADKRQISSMMFNSQVPRPQCALSSIDASVTTNSGFVDVVTIGSVLVKVNDAKSPGLLTAHGP